MIGIYITSDNSIINEDNLINWLLFDVKHNKEKRGWNFDDLTGGVYEFTDKIFYERAKKRFESTTEIKHLNLKLN